MNDSLQRYLDFRRMMLRQADERSAKRPAAFGSTECKIGETQDRRLMEYAAMLQQAAAQVEAMRLTLKAVSGTMTLRDLADYRVA